MTKLHRERKERGRKLEASSYVFLKPSLVFLPALIWGRTWNYHLGVLQYGSRKSWSNRIFLKLDVRKIDAGHLTTNYSMESPWVAMGAPLRSAVEEAGGAKFLPRDSPETSRIFRGHLYEKLAESAFRLRIAVDWSLDYRSYKLRFFSDSSLDSLLAGSHSGVAVRMSTLVGSCARVVERVAKGFQHLSMKVVWKVNRSLVRNSLHVTHMTSSAPRQEEATVLVVANHGLNYSGLYSYGFLLSPDTESPRSAKRVAYLAANSRTLENGESAIGLDNLRSYSDRAMAFFAVVSGIRNLPHNWRELHVLLRYVGFFSRSGEYERSLRKMFPRIRMAILMYDIRTPLPLFCALRSMKVKTVSNHERPQIGLVPYLPVVADTLLVESHDFARQLQTSDFASFNKLIPVGLWRTDSIHKFRQRQSNPVRPVALVLPLTLPDNDDENVKSSEMSEEGFVHFLEEVLRLAEGQPGVDFVIRTKHLDWLSDQRVSGLVTEISKFQNVEIDDNYSRHFEAYRICAQSHVVIAKYTSMVDESLACGIPVIVHDYTHNRHSGACISSRHIPSEFFAHNFDEMKTQFADIVGVNRQKNLDKLEATRMGVYGGLADGNVISRIQETLDAIYESDPNP